MTKIHRIKKYKHIKIVGAIVALALNAFILNINAYKNTKFGANIALASKLNFNNVSKRNNGMNRKMPMQNTNTNKKFDNNLKQTNSTYKTAQRFPTKNYDIKKTTPKTAIIKPKLNLGNNNLKINSDTKNNFSNIKKCENKPALGGHKHKLNSELYGNKPIKKNIQKPYIKKACINDRLKDQKKIMHYQNVQTKVNNYNVGNGKKNTLGVLGNFEKNKKTGQIKNNKITNMSKPRRMFVEKPKVLGKKQVNNKFYVTFNPQNGENNQNELQKSKNKININNNKIFNININLNIINNNLNIDHKNMIDNRTNTYGINKIPFNNKKEKVKKEKVKKEKVKKEKVKKEKVKKEKVKKEEVKKEDKRKNNIFSNDNTKSLTDMIANEENNKRTTKTAKTLNSKELKDDFKKEEVKEEEEYEREEFYDNFGSRIGRYLNFLKKDLEDAKYLHTDNIAYYEMKFKEFGRDQVNANKLPEKYQKILDKSTRLKRAIFDYTLSSCNINSTIKTKLKNQLVREGVKKFYQRYFTNEQEKEKHLDTWKKILEYEKTLKQAKEIYEEECGIYLNEYALKNGLDVPRVVFEDPEYKKIIYDIYRFVKAEDEAYKFERQLENINKILSSENVTNAANEAFTKGNYEKLEQVEDLLFDSYKGENTIGKDTHLSRYDMKNELKEFYKESQEKIKNNNIDDDLMRKLEVIQKYNENFKKAKEKYLKYFSKRKDNLKVNEDKEHEKMMEDMENINKFLVNNEEVKIELDKLISFADSKIGDAIIKCEKAIKYLSKKISDRKYVHKKISQGLQDIEEVVFLYKKSSIPYTYLKEGQEHVKKTVVGHTARWYMDPKSEFGKEYKKLLNSYIGDKAKFKKMEILYKESEKIIKAAEDFYYNELYKYLEESQKNEFFNDDKFNENEYELITYSNIMKRFSNITKRLNPSFGL